MRQVEQVNEDFVLCIFLPHWTSYFDA